MRVRTHTYTQDCGVFYGDLEVFRVRIQKGWNGSALWNEKGWDIDQRWWG